MKEKFKQIVKPQLQEQTLYQMNQLKSFVDASLIELGTKKFNDESEKTKYLLNTLYQLRDFIFSQLTENSLRINLIKQFNLIETEILGNENVQSKEESNSQSLEEKLEQNPKPLEQNGEIIENTPNS